jgi:hypothetical protein
MRSAGVTVATDANVASNIGGRHSAAPCWASSGPSFTLERRSSCWYRPISTSFVEGGEREHAEQAGHRAHTEHAAGGVRGENSAQQRGGKAHECECGQPPARERRLEQDEDADRGRDHERDQPLTGSIPLREVAITSAWYSSGNLSWLTRFEMSLATGRRVNGPRHPRRRRCSA